MKLNLPPKLRIFLPIFAGIIISIVAITILSINTAKDTLYASIRENLQLEVHNLMKMFEREYALKLEKVKTDLRVAHDYFHEKDLDITGQEVGMTATNQLSGKSHPVQVNRWTLDGKQLQKNFELVDQLQSLFGGTVTIFQKIDSGLLRISTNVLKSDGSRAVGTYIPNHSPVVKSINSGKTYIGRAFVVNDWYITAYEPIYHEDEIIGALYVGGKEKDLENLREIIMGTTLGRSGFPYVFDDNATFVIHPVSEGENWAHLEFMQEIMRSKKGVIDYYSPTTKSKRLTAYDYFEDFHLYIGATINPGAEAEPLINRIITNSIIFGLIILVALSLFVYFVAAESIHRYLKAIEASNRKLSSAQAALRRTEKLAEVGQLSSAIAKEINRPLNEIATRAAGIMENFDPDSSIYVEMDRISRQAEKSKSILSGILSLSQDTRLSLKETSVNEMIEVAINELEIPENIRLTFDKDPENPMIYLDTNKMIQAIKNLVKNGIEAMPKGGKLRVKAFSGGRKFAVSVRDEGTGIDEDRIEKLFEPYYSGEEARAQKAGLGLAVTYGIVKMHEGEINVKSNTDPAKGQTGTEIVISFPRN